MNVGDFFCGATFVILFNVLVRSLYGHLGMIQGLGPKFMPSWLEISVAAHTNYFHANLSSTLIGLFSVASIIRQSDTIVRLGIHELYVKSSIVDERVLVKTSPLRYKVDG